jgi:hypothetical protein
MLLLAFKSGRAPCTAAVLLLLLLMLLSIWQVAEGGHLCA